MRVSLAPLTGSDGSVSGAFASLVDVDEVVRAESALAEQDRLLQETLDAEVDPHVRLVPVRDAAGVIVDFRYAQANRAACEYNGVPRERLVGMRLLDLLPGHLGSGLLRQYAEVVQTGQPLIVDDLCYELEVRAGQQRFFDVRAVRVGDGLSYVWRDVTDRHEAAEELAAEREQFRSAMEAASIGMCLIGPDGAFLRVNPALCALLGRDEVTLRASTWQQLTHPDDLDVDQSLVDDVLAGRRDRYRLRKRYLRPDGGIVWGELSVSCVRDRDGRVRHFVSQIVDMTTEHQQREALEEAREQYRLLAENATDVVVRTDAAGVLTYCSDGIRRTLGLTPEQVIGRRVLDLVHPDDLPTAQAPPSGREPDLIGPYRIRLRDGHGDYRWIEATARAVRDGHGEPAGHVGGWHDVTAEVVAEQELHRRASTDALTGLLNRAEILTRLDAILAHPPRTGSTLGLAFIDLDRLKAVNDNRGHAVGDLLLDRTAARVRGAVREEDLVARLGGDELLVLLPGVHDLGEAAAIAETIRATVAEPIPVSGGDPVFTTASIGVTLARPGDTVDLAVTRADEAMYRAKSDGGNQVTAFP